MKRTFENDLINPAVMALASLYAKTGNRNIKSDDFRMTLRNMVDSTLSEDDLVVHPSRKEYKEKSDKRIDQIIRNLISHRKLDGLGLAKYNSVTRVFSFKRKGINMAENILKEMIAAS